MIDRCPRVGRLASGARDLISDVAGVTVGHLTLDAGEVQTGVTVVRPHGGDCYRDRVPAGFSVINGFGKSIGLVQVEELGVLETPIVLTNTFSVPAMAQGLIRQCVSRHPSCGRDGPSVNPLVFECNDGWLNDMQRMALGPDDLLRAFDAASASFEQGSCGAGRGMSCFGLKGGVGSASRIAQADGRSFMVGVLVLANFGVPGRLVMAGQAIDTHAAGGTPAGLPLQSVPPEAGSIILLVATDAPLDSRQLRRLSLRAGAGLARTGSFFGHGSGDIALAFSTAYTLAQDRERAMPATVLLHDAWMDGLFQAAAEGAEQAIVHALWHATSVQGRDGRRRESLNDFWRRTAKPS